MVEPETNQSNKQAPIPLVLDQLILKEISARLDTIDERLEVVEKKEIPSYESLMADTLQKVNEVVAQQIKKVTDTHVETTNYDKFTSATVDALEQEKERIGKLEKLILGSLKKYKSKHVSSIKQLELNFDSKVTNLLRGEVQDKFDVFIDAFDSKLKKLNAKLDKTVETRNEIS